MPKILINDINSQYIINENEYFTYVAFSKKIFLPSKGWKLHVSAYFDNYHDILDIVYKYCFKKNISFKFINNTELFSEIVGKYCDRYSACKFITLYFPSIKCFKITCNDLYRLLKKFSAGFILSDRRYKDSNVLYYRYGEYFGKNTNTNRILLDYKPENIADPFEFSIKNSIPTEVILNNKYKIISALHFSNFGGIYCSNHYIIKEARPGTGESIVNTSIKLREDEFNLTSFLFKKQINVPKAIEHFIQEEHHFFVYEKLDGLTLNEHKLFQKLFYAKDSLIKPLSNAWEWFNAIITEIKKIHKENIILNDISESNIFISKNCVYFIDLEYSYNLNSEIKDKQLLNYSDTTYTKKGYFDRDLQKLYYVILSVLSGLNMYLQVEKSGMYVLDLFSVFCKYTVISSENRDTILLNANSLGNMKFKNNYDFNIDYDYFIENIKQNLNIIEAYIKKWSNTLIFKNQKNKYSYISLKNEIDQLISNISIDNKIIYIKNGNNLSPNLSDGTALLLKKILLFTNLFKNYKYLYLIKDLYKSLTHNLSRKVDYLEGNLGIIHSLIDLYKFKRKSYIKKAILLRYSLYIDTIILNQKYNIDYMNDYSIKRKSQEIAGIYETYTEILKIMEDI